MNPRKITALIWFAGVIVFLLISALRPYYIWWLVLGAIIMFIESGIDSNWIIEKKISSLFRDNTQKEVSK